jgi:sulfide dehydrogenase [flavocytochrome c] flavoprotein chain
MQRRSFLHTSAALSLLGLGACASTGSIPSKARVVVVGGG